MLRVAAMNRTLLVCGYGIGISEAVARKFGKEGYSVALVARGADRIAASAAALTQAGITAKAFPCDLAKPEAVRALVREVSASLGPIAVVHWNAYSGGAGDLVAAPIDELRAIVDVSVYGLVAAVQEALPDLKAQKGAVLITGGGLGTHDPQVDAMAVGWGAMGLAVGKAAQHKVAGLLHARLAREGVFAGEVVVMGMVKGTPWDQGNATLEASTVADRFWSLYQAREPATVSIS